MEPWVDLGLVGTAAALGAGGALHCAGMCSAPVAWVHRAQAAIPIRVEGAVLRSSATLPFHAGRVGGYALTGGLAGFAALPAKLLRPETALPWLTALLVLGLILYSPLGRAWLHLAYVRTNTLLQPLVPQSPRAARFLWGMAWTLLPCGLLHAALALALLSGTAFRGALIGAVFALSSSWGIAAGTAVLRAVGQRLPNEGKVSARLAWVGIVTFGTGALWFATTLGGAQPWWCG